MEVSYDTSTQRINRYTGGNAVTVNAPRSTNAYATTAGYMVGDWSDFNRPFTGNVAEVLVFDRVINAAERILINNYLASKWNPDTPVITLAASTDHYAGDTPANGNYDRDVFGIGRVDANNLVSSSGNIAGLHIDAMGGTLDNGEWLLAGHNVASNSLTSADVVGMSRWSRSWYVDTNDSHLDVNFGFDFSDSGLTGPLSGEPFYLLFRDDESSLFTPLAVTGTVSGDMVTFSLLDGQFTSGYYTLGLVPEPSALVALLGLGAVGALLAWQRRRTGI
jgi:MYXO-CTERM domain-containing protein